MKPKRILRILIVLAILSSNVGCDQISKNFVRKHLHEAAQIDLIDNYLTLNLMKVENTGAFLSLGSSWPEPVKFFLLAFIPMLALAFGVVFVLTTRRLTRMTLTGFCFIVGGGIGNIYDRLVYGSVTDFLHMDFLIFRTGIFNMADVSVMIGAFMVFLDAFSGRQKAMFRGGNQSPTVK